MKALDSFSLMKIYISIFLFVGCSHNLKVVNNNNLQTKNDFLELTTTMLSLLNEREKLTVEESIICCKIYNTIAVEKELKGDNSLYLNFNDVFVGKHLDFIIDLLNAKLAAGMGYYSLKHDLYIGGKFPIVRSRYQLK